MDFRTEKRTINCLVTGKEKIYFGVMLFISITLYILLFASIIGAIYLLIIGICLFFAQGMAIGNLRQNSIKISEEQFNDIHNKVVEYSKKLQLNDIPDVYIMQSGGILNSFAMRFLFKDIIVLYSDVVELAYEQGEDAVNFVIAHELAHVKRKHLSKKVFIVLACIIPFLGAAYNRACENTCDRIAVYLIDKISIDVFLLLSTGKKLYKKVNTENIIINSCREKGFWGWFSEICATHPTILTRIKNVSEMRKYYSK